MDKRRLLACAFTLSLFLTSHAVARTNSIEPLDVNADGYISALDAVWAINAINDGGIGPISGDVPTFYRRTYDLYLDVNGDDFLSVQDVVLVISRLNEFAAESSEGNISMMAVVEESSEHGVTVGVEVFDVLPADIDQNGVVDYSDAMLVYRFAVFGVYDSRLDYTADARLGPDDFHFYITHLMKADVGDVDGDGLFCYRDAIVMLETEKYQTNQDATFLQGDWNVDGVFDQHDIQAIFSHGSGSFFNPECVN